MHPPLPAQAIDQSFRSARTLDGFGPEPVSDETLRALHDHGRMQ